MATMLRVHSQDLHEHVASEAGECLDSGLYTDLAIRCGTEFNPVSLVSWNFTTKISENHLLTRCEGGHLIRAHRIVLAAVSPYLRQLLAIETETNEVVTLDLPDAAQVTETLSS